MVKVNLQEMEAKWSKYWEEHQIYAFDENSDKSIYSIDTPPPTVSGKMHLGHAFSYAQQDFIARYKKMKGFNVFYPFGTDDNGLATDKLIEKIKKVKSSKMPRKEYTKLCLETLIELRKEYIKDWKSIGISCDWKINYTTIDEESQKISQKSFLDLYKLGREYRKEAPTIWCPKCETAISQVELKDEEKETFFNDIVFLTEEKEKIIIATTRPELLCACVGVFVHPEDKKYSQLIGKKLKVPLYDLWVDVRADERVDMQKGTGIVMCCTFGDQNDIEWFKAFNLNLREGITKNGKMTEIAGKYSGMNIEEARKEIIEDLKKENLLISQKKIIHEVNTHERCGTSIEIVNSLQWFIKYLDLKDEFVARGKEMNWFPKHFISRYENWIQGLQWDWCISRQRNFGVPFPVWYCKKCSEVILAEEKDLPVDPVEDKPSINKCKCGNTEFIPEKDVLDTWATSSLTPKLAIEKFKEKKIYKKLFPMDLRPQAHDIITFWLFNTIVKSHLHNNSIPFKNIMISGWALDPKGKKMSKSKGNVIHPQDIIKKYSADCLRYWAGQTSLGDDSPLSEKEFIAAQKFINKLINASKFVSELTKNFNLNKFNLNKAVFASTDKWILSRLNSIKKEATESLEKYEFSKALTLTRNFFWLEFADYYIEEVKYRMYNETKNKKEAQYTLLTVITDCLKLLAPFLPYITEEIMQINFKELMKSKSIHNEFWPEINENLIDLKTEEKGKTMNSIIAGIRKIKSLKQKAMNSEMKKIKIFMEKNVLEETELIEIKKTMNVKEIELVKEKDSKFIEIEQGIELKEE
jgi:valyl-tRNA synthetase